MSDVITVPSHTKKDNPKAALNPVCAVSDATVRRAAPQPGGGPPARFQLRDPLTRGDQLPVVAAGMPGIWPLSISCCRRQV